MCTPMSLHWIRPGSCSPLVANTMAAAAIFSQLSGRFAKFVCGALSPTTTKPDEDDDERGNHRSELRSFLLLSSSSPERQQPRRRTAEAPVDNDGNDNDVTAAAAASVAEVSTEHGGHDEEEESAMLPCLAFASEHGYMVFSLADMRMLDVPPMPPVPGRRLVASPYGGTVLAADVCYRHPCHLADPFTGPRLLLPDLPIPFSEKEPVGCLHDEPRGPRCARATDDGLAWDWSPRGVMLARGDTAFFCAHGEQDSQRRWTPVHQSRLGSPMTVNYRGGLFFVLELRTLETTVIDAGTLRAGARIPAPPGLGDVDNAYLAPSANGDAILLVHRAGDGRGTVFTEAYRARHGGGGRRRPPPPRWKPVLDVGDRAVFVDGAHGFTVAADPAGAKANRVYVVLAHRVTRPCGRLAVAYDVGFSDIARPERVGRIKLDAGEVERMWGQPHWIIPREGSDRRRQGSVN